VAKGASLSKEAPYFVDLVADAVQTKFQDQNFQSNAFRITHARPAPAGCRGGSHPRGMHRSTTRSGGNAGSRDRQFPNPGGAGRHRPAHRRSAGAGRRRNYGTSQLNHVLSKRQPGSIFKPFVYAAALDTAVDGGRV